jgi:hypothetical protein
MGMWRSGACGELRKAGGAAFPAAPPRFPRSEPGEDERGGHLVPRGKATPSPMGRSSFI